KITYIKKSIENRLIGLIEEGLEWVLTSGQLGVELWTVEVLIELQKTYDIKFAIIPAFENHHSRWPDELKIKYSELIQAADFYEITNDLISFKNVTFGLLKKVMLV